MDENEKPEEKFKGFLLSEFAEPDRAQALITLLNLDGETDAITEEQDYYFKVNPRKTKDGTSPAQYEAVASDFKALLSARRIRQLSLIVKSNLRKKPVIIQHGQKTDHLYKLISKEIEAKKETPEYARLAAHALHVVNVLYHLLSVHEKKGDFIEQYQRAFLGYKLEDTRELREHEDGEYLVLTDDEADDRAHDYIGDDPDLWKQAVASGNTELGFDEWVKMVLDTDGRGMLAGYDGEENQQTVDGTEYFIYRTN